MCLSFKTLRKTFNQQPASEATRPGTRSEAHLAQSGSLNLNDEYAKAFRTQSYADIWKKAQHVSTDQGQETGDTSASPFHCYGVLAEHILEPDQETVKEILQRGLMPSVPELYDLVSDYFNNSAEASKLCGDLLKNIEQAKLSYRCVKNVLDTTPSTGDLSTEQCHFTIAELLMFMKVDNPFADPTSQNFQNIHESYSSLLKRLDKNQKRLMKKLKLLSGCKKASVVWIIGASTAIAICAVVIASHALIAIVAAPVLLTFPSNFVKQRIDSLRLFRTSVLARQRAQLDAAARGTYLLNRDFDTISCLVTRLHDEVEHNKVMINFCLERKDEIQPVQMVVSQLRSNDPKFNQQLDELEERVYLCFLTINRARSMVVQEIQLQQPLPLPLP